MVFKLIVFIFIFCLVGDVEAELAEELKILPNQSYKIERQTTQGVFYSFFGKKDDRMDLKVRSLLGPDLILTVQDPNGKNITSLCTENMATSSDGCDAVTGAWHKVLEVTGYHTLRLDLMEPTQVKFELTLTHGSAKEVSISKNICENLDLTFLEKEFEDCVSQGGSLQEKQCLDQSIKIWDEKLNQYYQALLAERGEQKFLKESQREWIQHKDLEFEYYKSLVKDSEGSMYPILIKRWELQFIKYRVLQMQTLLKFLCTEK